MDELVGIKVKLGGVGVVTPPEQKLLPVNETPEPVVEKKE